MVKTGTSLQLSLESIQLLLDKSVFNASVSTKNSECKDVFQCSENDGEVLRFVISENLEQIEDLEIPFPLVDGDNSIPPIELDAY